MVDMKELISVADLSLKQMLFFYELCKIGAVRFDLTNKTHVQVLTDMVEKVSAYDESTFDDQSEHYILERRNRHQLHYLIVLQLIKNSFSVKNL